MKKTLTLISLLAGATAAYSQGSIAWQEYNEGSFSISVWSVNYSSPSTLTIGNGAADIPSAGTTYGTAVLLGGTTTGSGTGLSGAYNGNSYEMGLYADTSAAAVAADVLGTGSTAIQATDTIINFGGAGEGGYWTGNPLSANLPAFAGKSTVYFELAAWYSAGGAGTYAAAVAAGVPAGHDNASTVAIELGGGSSPAAVETNLNGSGLQSFDLAVAASTPEPSTIALGVIGASAFLFRRRK